MIEPQRCWISEPEGYLFQIYLQGAGAGTPTRVTTGTRNNYTITRTGVGVIVIKFQDDPGPTFLGADGGGFGDATASNVAGWTTVAGAYVARSGITPAQFTFTIFNSSFAAADLASTSTLAMQLCFKQAAPAE